jgi:predicted HTH domain antitoxin
MKTLSEQLGISEKVLSSLHISKENPEDLLKALAAVALFQTKKISFTEAVRIAGIHKREFETVLFDMGVPYEFYTVENLEQDLKTLGLK